MNAEARTASDPATRETRITRRGLSFLAEMSEVWRYRELFFFLVWRDVKVKYKQTILGILWAMLKPVVSMVVFTVVFGKMAKLDASIGLEPSYYPIFLFSALVPWTYFSNSLNRASQSLVGSSNLVTKVYFPRIIIPASAALSGAVDFFFAFVVMCALMAWFGVVPGLPFLAIPVLFLLTYFLAMSVSLCFAAAHVRFRDAGFILGYFIQIWIYLTPVIWPLKLLPEKYRVLASLNPMTGVIEAFRWSFLASKWDFPGQALLISLCVAVLAFTVGQWYFRRVERTFADVI